jgi:hypothetical protein
MPKNKPPAADIDRGCVRELPAQIKALWQLPG